LHGCYLEDKKYRLEKNIVEFNLAATVIVGAREVQFCRLDVKPPNDTASAIVITLSPENFTAIERDKNNVTGVGLVEVYNILQGSSGSVKRWRGSAIRRDMFIAEPSSRLPAPLGTT